MNEVTEQEKARKEAARALLGTVSCIVGILCGALGILYAILGASNNVSAGAIGAALGILGYFLQQFANRVSPCKDAEHGHLLERTQDQGGRGGRAEDTQEGRRRDLLHLP